MNDNTKRDVLALIPAYNEAKHIAAVITQARQYAPVLVVDDGSADETYHRAEGTGVVVMQHAVNQGKGATLRTGFQYALEEGYQAVLTLDADGQHDPHEIPKFIELFHQSHPDLIIGRRRFREMPMVRRVSNWIGRTGFSWVMGRRIPDNQSGYRLISRRLIETLLDSEVQGFEFEVEMIIACIEHDFKLDWVPIRTIYADEVSHIQPLQHIANFTRLLWDTHQRLHASNDKPR